MASPLLELADVPLSSIQAFLDGIRDLTGAGAQADRSVKQLAAEWIAKGLRPGDVVLLALPNGAGLLAHVFAVLAAQGVPALVSPASPASRQQSLVEALPARALVAMRSPAPNMTAAERFSLGGAEVALFPDALPPGAQPGEMVLLTSGTSGFASGCVFDLPALFRNADRHADALGLRAGDTALINLPLYYSYSMVAQAFSALRRGLELVISGPPFQPAAYLRLLAEHGITVSALTPLLTRGLLQHGEPFPEELRCLGVGGDVLAPEHVKHMLRLRPRGELYLTYGLSEAGPRVSTLAAHAEPEPRFASVGLPLPGTEVSLVPRIPGGERELFVSSDTVMKRRIGIVEGEKLHALRGPQLLATGDVFDIDDDGYLYFQGRLSDFLVRGSEKISMASVRRLAMMLPGVLTARTKVIRGAEGDDYEVMLTVEDERCSVDHLSRELFRLLRLAERPRSVQVVAADLAAASLHK
ncbi:class I adenylate-forming enzyme family protein [Stigmatella aurantiaca]|uniref:Coronafacic acid synthetase, ligase component n=1 Tax=Stigmatella aurantiaca (strain DW4/3-1) TaxID=378806 RepID=Q08QZ3_STIAD|nr:class I adenylate-forming enzyme family protein [Stigmatella aurantiaca]ADO70565.1 Coronafacic acid synthetase, ligase component [Stigmatella aurantiaca DW4/3-1]EAU62910.1 coronafacic acid synthetase, ligase component [Stigmatella aurantiaca DW4/3-1]